MSAGDSREVPKNDKYVYYWKLQIYGNPKLSLNKKIVIKNFLKDHRVFMTSVVAALSFGGQWKIHDKDSIKTSFPNFLKIIKELQIND